MHSHCLEGAAVRHVHAVGRCLQEGDLDSAIKKYKGYLPEDDIMLKFVQIALALHYTHSKVIFLAPPSPTPPPSILA